MNKQLWVLTQTSRAGGHNKVLGVFSTRSLGVECADALSGREHDPEWQCTMDDVPTGAVFYMRQWPDGCTSVYSLVPFDVDPKRCHTGEHLLSQCPGDHGK